MTLSIVEPISAQVNLRQGSDNLNFIRGREKGTLFHLSLPLIEIGKARRADEILDWAAGPKEEGPKVAESAEDGAAVASLRNDVHGTVGFLDGVQSRCLPGETNTTSPGALSALSC